MSPQSLVVLWRRRAADLRSWGAPDGVAKAWELAAEELEQASDELLTLTAAAAECGYTADHLGRLVKTGKLPNHGADNAPPRVKRSELPRRKTRPASATTPIASRGNNGVSLGTIAHDAILSKTPRARR